MDREIVDYIVLEGSNDELRKLVLSKLSQGWAPLGGVAVAANRPTIGRLNCTYIQAMVRYKSSVPPPLPTAG